MDSLAKAYGVRAIEPLLSHASEPTDTDVPTVLYEFYMDESGDLGSQGAAA